MKQHTSHHQHGFTIIELLFATVVFSVILLLCLASLIQIGKLYYKGVTTSQTQETARNVMDEISQSIQLSAAAVTQSSFSGGPDIASGASYSGYTGYFCIGDLRYSYAIDRALTDGTPSFKEIKHVLWVDKVKDCAKQATPIAPTIDLTQTNPGGTDGRELLGAHMRLLRLNLTQPVAATDVWKVDLDIGYGDDDLFMTDTSVTPHNKHCKTAEAGTQFCATSELTTIINRRLVSLL